MNETDEILRDAWAEIVSLRTQLAEQTRRAEELRRERDDARRSATLALSGIESAEAERDDARARLAAAEAETVEAVIAKLTGDGCISLVSKVVDLDVTAEMQTATEDEWEGYIVERLPKLLRAALADRGAR